MEFYQQFLADMPRLTIENRANIQYQKIRLKHGLFSHAHQAPYIFVFIPILLHPGKTDELKVQEECSYNKLTTR